MIETYKNIFESEDYKLIDAVLTTNYLMVILTENDVEYSNSELIARKCLNLPINIDNQQFPLNLLKIYSWHDLIQVPFYKRFVTNSSILISNLNFFGNGDYFLLYDFQIYLMQLYQLSGKFMTLVYNSSGRGVRENYAPFFLKFEVNYSFYDQNYNTNEYLVVCVINQNYSVP